MLGRGRTNAWLLLAGWTVGLVALAMVTYVGSIVCALMVSPTTLSVRVGRSAALLLIVALMCSLGTRHGLGPRALGRWGGSLRTPWALLLPLLVATAFLPMAWTGHLLWADALDVPGAVRALLDLVTWLAAAGLGILAGALASPRREWAVRRQEFEL